MRVGLNATCFNDRPSGARQRFIGLYGALIARRPDIEFILFEPVDCRVVEWFGGAPNVSARPTPLPSASPLGRTLGGLSFWRAAFKREQLNLFEQFHLPMVKAPGCPTILTIHDPRSVLPEVPLGRRLLPLLVYRHALSRADHIVTVSETIRRELIGLGAEVPVTSIYNGIDPAPFRHVPTERALLTQRRYRLAAGPILAVGHLEERKNYRKLIEAIALLRERNSAISLVIVGNDAGDSARLRAQIGQAGLSEHVTLLQGVSDDELTDIYQLSSLVVFPSRYEGFGIPILEAMAADRALVLSDIAVFKELTENQGAYFPTDDSAAIAATLERVLSSSDERRRIVDYGRRRVTHFKYDQLAIELDALYRSILGEDAGRTSSSNAAL